MTRDAWGHALLFSGALWLMLNGARILIIMQEYWSVGIPVICMALGTVILFKESD